MFNLHKENSKLNKMTFIDFILILWFARFLFLLKKKMFECLNVTLPKLRDSEVMKKISQLLSFLAIISL